MSVVVKKRVCRECGINFDGGPRAWYCPVCRAERKRKQKAEHEKRKKTGNNRLLGNTYKCEICGEDYTLESGTQRFCKKCAPIHLKEVDNKQSKNWNKIHTEEMKVHKENEKKRHEEIKENLQYYSANPSNIARLRKSKGFSQHKLSVLSGLNTKSISRLENAESLETTTLGTLEKIASALGMSPVEFISELYK